MDDLIPKSLFTLPIDDAEEARLDALANAEIEDGLGVPHEKVREWMMKRAKGEKIPPPSA